MSKTIKSPEDKTEIVVSTYWPTRIIKSIDIKDLSSSYNNTVTLDTGQAKYLYEQLCVIYGEKPFVGGSDE